MKKKQRIRWDISVASRGTTLGADRTSAMNIIEHKYNLSSDGVGGTHSMGLYISGGDYWV